MRHIHYFLLLGLLLLTVSIFSQPSLKIDSRQVIVGESLNYKATWGIFTIGSANTKIDKQLYKIGSVVCYKIEINGQTNGLAKLFNIRDKWISYIDTATITTHQTFRSIREGGYELDELIRFNHADGRAEVKVYDKKTKTYVVKKNYETPELIRDVVAGFMVFRLVNMNGFSKGDIFSINGFYEDEVYKLDVLYVGEESIKTENGIVRCLRYRPFLPKNKVFKGKEAVDIWLSADKSKSIVKIQAKLFLGNLLIDLQP